MSLRNSFTPYNSNVATMVFIGTSFDCTAILNAVAMVVKKLAAAPDMLKSYLKKNVFRFCSIKVLTVYVAFNMNNCVTFGRLRCVEGTKYDVKESVKRTMNLFPTDFEGFDICEFCHYSSFVEISFPLKKKKVLCKLTPRKNWLPLVWCWTLHASKFFFYNFNEFSLPNRVCCNSTEYNRWILKDLLLKHSIAKISFQHWKNSAKMPASEKFRKKLHAQSSK